VVVNESPSEEGAEAIEFLPRIIPRLFLLLLVLGGDAVDEDEYDDDDEIGTGVPSLSVSVGS